MFQRSSKPKGAKVDSIIGQNTILRGNVNYHGGLHVDGIIKGNVTADEDSDSTLSVSEHGVIEGDVRAAHVMLNGTVIGDVYALERIELAPNAKVSGSVYYKLIEMAMGSEVNGNLIHQTAEKKPATEIVPPNTDSTNTDSTNTDSTNTDSNVNVKNWTDGPDDPDDPVQPVQPVALDSTVQK